MNIKLSAEDRYRNDPVFHLLVDALYNQIVQHQFTPGELRDAAMLAAIKFEQMHLRDIFTGNVK